MCKMAMLFNDPNGFLEHIFKMNLFCDWIFFASVLRFHMIDLAYRLIHIFFLES